MNIEKLDEKNTAHYFIFQEIVKEKIPPPQKGKKNMAVEIDLEKEAEFDYDWLTKEDY